MIAFWVAAGVISAAAAGLVLHRAASATQTAGSSDPTMAVFRRQLGEIDDLADRGLIGEDERRLAHAEAGRRLLTAADAPAQVWTADPAARHQVLAVVALAALLSLGFYLALGIPSAPDQPFKGRVKAWRAGDIASLSPPQMAAVLTEATREKPDAEGFRFLAIAQSQSDNPSGAARALRHAITLEPRRGDLWEMLGITLVDQASGEESPGAVTAFREAARLSPQQAVLSRFHLARAQAQAGDRAGAAASLRALLAGLPVGDPRRASLMQSIAQADHPQADHPQADHPQADHPQAPAAPVITTPAASGQMDMIRGMVAGLAGRLADKPDDPAGWVRLVRSYAVLGDVGQRDKALASARGRFAGRIDVLRDLEAAAKTEPMK